MTQNETTHYQQVTTLMARVFALVRACPAGRVTTYGWLAKAIGYPRGARMVGWFMNECPEDVPAQRVLNSKGELTGSWAFKEEGLMKKLLENEGVEVSDNEQVNIKKYAWNPNIELSATELQSILDSASTATLPVTGRLIKLMQTDIASPLRDQP